MRDHALLNEHGIEIEGHYIELCAPDRARFAKALCDLGRHGPQPIPVELDHCRQALSYYDQYCKQLQAELLKRAGQKIADGKLQARVVKLLQALLA